MPRPLIKSELLAANQDAYESLKSLLDSLSPADLARPFSFPHRDQNVRDVLAHVLEWQKMLFGWYKIGMRGGMPEMPHKDFSWRDTPALNRRIWKNYQSMSLPEVRQKLNRSHVKLQKLVQQHSNQELFTKKRYHWTGSTSLAIYFRAGGWSHYQWALKLLRKYVKQIRSQKHSSL